MHHLNILEAKEDEDNIFDFLENDWKEIFPVIGDRIIIRHLISELIKQGVSINSFLKCVLQESHLQERTHML